MAVNSSGVNAYQRMLASAVVASAQAKQAAAAAGAQQREATRAEVDPVRMDIRVMNNELKLTEAQRNKLRPIIAGEDKQFAMIKGSKWSDNALRRQALWKARDDTAKQMGRVLDAKQAEKFKAMVGPAK